MAGRRLEPLTLTEAERSELAAFAARPKTAQALAQRARIVLACAEGLENKVAAPLSRSADGGTAHSADPDQPFRPIAITDSGDPDHAVHYA